MTDVPHFAIPFQFVGPAAAVVEQDSVEEIAGCAVVVLGCPQGFRVELPEFGLPDPTFSWPVDAEQVAQTIQDWEPRAQIQFTQDELVELASDPYAVRIGVALQVRTEE